jgi:hypothetical protein
VLIEDFQAIDFSIFHHESKYGNRCVKEQKFQRKTATSEGKGGLLRMTPSGFQVSPLGD